MTAYSLGKEAADDGVGVRTDNPDPVTKALGVISALIPAEAIAGYLAIVAAIAAFPIAAGRPDYRPALNVWIAVPVGILVSLAVALIAAKKGIEQSKPAERPKKWRAAAGYGLGLGALFVVYVIAMPGNPVEVMFGVPYALGGLIAVLFTIGWGLYLAFRAA